MEIEIMTEMEKIVTHLKSAFDIISNREKEIREAMERVKEEKDEKSISYYEGMLSGLLFADEIVKITTRYDIGDFERDEKRKREEKDT